MCGESVANHANATIGSGDPESSAWSEVLRVASTEAPDGAGGTFTQHAASEAKSCPFSSGQGEVGPCGQQSPPLAESAQANAGEATPTRRPNQITSTVGHRRNTILRYANETGTEIRPFHEARSTSGVTN